ncbi:hypothetical protein SDC9_190091 [bioreactor metagenome]|uniref:Uncharacterized protein n=1 Tax=bioreactor metagenome TaxID=1076179 RepID=A0A645I241_9ZZZZ
MPADSSVTFTVNPASGKRVVVAYYTDKDGQHAIKNNHFVMPDSDVSISAVYGWSVLYVLLTLSMVLSLLGFSLWFLFRQTNSN